MYDDDDVTAEPVTDSADEAPEAVEADSPDDAGDDGADTDAALSPKAQEQPPVADAQDV